MTPNGYQKVTVLWSLIMGKLLFSSMVYDPLSAENYEKSSYSEKLLSQLFTGAIISCVSLPISVFLDRMFNFQQKMVHAKVAKDEITGSVRATSSHPLNACVSARAPPPAFWFALATPALSLPLVTELIDRV